MSLRKVIRAASFASLLWAAPSFADAPPRLEPVTVTKISVAASGDAQMRVNVASGGCTRAADFRVVVSPRAGGGESLRFERVRQDVCEMVAPDGTMIDLEVHGVRRGEPIFVENPLYHRGA